MNEDIPGKARSCLEEKNAREDLALLMGEQAKDVKVTRDLVQKLHEEMGEEPKVLSTDPVEKAGYGLKAILYNMRAEQKAQFDQLTKDVGEIKQQLPLAVSKRLQARIVSWGAVAGALVALFSLMAGCYSIAKSVQSLASSVQVVSVKP